MKSKLPPYNPMRLAKRFGRQGMGDLADVLELFGPQLEDYRLRLYELYNEKAQLTTDRETLRFLYLATWGAELKSGINKFASLLMSLGNSDILQMFQQLNMLSSMFNQIPLLTLDSKQASYKALGQDIYFSPGPYLTQWESGKFASLLSASETFYAVQYPMSSEQRSVIDENEYYLSTFNWDQESRAFMASIHDGSGMPPGFDKYLSYFKWHIDNAMIGEPSRRADMALAIDGAFKESGLPQILEKGKQLYRDLLKKTVAFVANYFSIKTLENDIRDFITSYSGLNDAMANVAVSDILKELMDFSKISQAQQIMTTPPATTTPAQTVVPGTTVPTLPAAEPAKNNKAIWIAAAAAAAGLLFLG